ncbi:MAG: hypothetical protein HY259_15370, partial [Chloroflexi bacterium]|nr:hypothetical protein [Chloroflexota bacterium]
FLHVHIFEAFAREVDTRWDISEADLIRIAAKGFEAWLMGEPIPDDHFNDRDMLFIDAAWYPRAASLSATNPSPALAANPYRFSVVTDEPYPTLDEMLPSPADSASLEPVEGRAPEPTAVEAPPLKQIVFGFTRDVFPGPLAIGYNQFKHKAADAGLAATVSLRALDDLPPCVDVLFVPQALAEAARGAVLQQAEGGHSCRVEPLDTFLNHPYYNAVLEELGSSAGSGSGLHAAKAPDIEAKRPAPAEGRAPEAK